MIFGIQTGVEDTFQSKNVKPHRYANKSIQSYMPANLHSAKKHFSEATAPHLAGLRLKNEVGGKRYFGKICKKQVEKTMLLGKIQKGPLLSR